MLILSIRLAVATVFVWVGALPAFAQVLSGGILFDPPELLAGIEGTVFESPFTMDGIDRCHGVFCGEHTHVSMQLAEIIGSEKTLENWASLSGRSSLLDEGSDWYLVREGEVFGPTALADAQVPYIIGVDSGFGIATSSVPITASQFIAGEPFFIGVAATGPDTPFGERSAFGWAKVRVVPGTVGEQPTLEILDAAMAYNARAIIIGSLAAVPEPTGIALTCFAAMLLPWQPRR